MNLRTIAAAILATVFCTGLGMAATPPDSEWSDITPVQGVYSKIYFDYQQENPGDPGMFHCINDWVVNQADGCLNGGLVCRDTVLAKGAMCILAPVDTCEANVFKFTIAPNNYTIKVYPDHATIDPMVPGFDAKFSWNTSVNEPSIEHTIWEFWFPIHPTMLVNFTGHDPAVATDTVFNPPPPAIIINGPSAYTHYLDGQFANYVGPQEVCTPTVRCYIPADSLPKDPHIPPLTIILHEGGGVTVIPQGVGPIPTLSEWGAIIFGTLLLAGVAFYIWRRRRAVAA